MDGKRGDYEGGSLFTTTAEDVSAVLLFPQLPTELRREVFSHLDVRDMTALSGTCSALRSAIVEPCRYRIAKQPRLAWIGGKKEQISKLEKPASVGWPVWCRSLCDERCLHCGSGRNANMRLYSPWCADSDGLTPPAPVCRRCWNRYPYYRISWDDALRCFYLEKKDIKPLARENYSHVGETPLIYFERDIAEVASRKYAGRTPASTPPAERAMSNHARHRALKAALAACGVSEPEDLSLDPFVHGGSIFGMKEAVQFYVRWDEERRNVRARYQAVKKALAASGVFEPIDPRYDPYVFWGPAFHTLADSVRSHLLRHLLNWHTYAGERTDGTTQLSAVPKREVQAKALYHLYGSQLARTPRQLELSSKCLTCVHADLLDVQPRIESLQQRCAGSESLFVYPLIINIPGELYPKEYKAAWEAETDSGNAVSRRRQEIDAQMVRVLNLGSEARQIIWQHPTYRRYVETGAGRPDLERLLSSLISSA